MGKKRVKPGQGLGVRKNDIAYTFFTKLLGVNVRKVENAEVMAWLDATPMTYGELMNTLKRVYGQKPRLEQINKFFLAESPSVDLSTLQFEPGKEYTPGREIVLGKGLKEGSGLNSNQRKILNIFFGTLIGIDTERAGNKRLLECLKKTKYTSGQLKEYLRKKYGQKPRLEQINEFFLAESLSVDLSTLQFKPGKEYTPGRKIDLGPGRRKPNNQTLTTNQQNMKDLFFRKLVGVDARIPENESVMAWIRATQKTVGQLKEYLRKKYGQKPRLGELNEFFLAESPSVDLNTLVYLGRKKYNARRVIVLGSRTRKSDKTPLTVDQQNIKNKFFKELIYIDAIEEGNEELLEWIRAFPDSYGELKKNLKKGNDDNQYITLEKLNEFFLEETSAVDLESLKYMDGYSYDDGTIINLGKVKTPAVFNHKERDLNNMFFKKLLHIDAADEGNQNLVGWIKKTTYSTGTLKKELREQYGQNITLKELKEFFSNQTPAVNLESLKYIEEYSYNDDTNIDLGKIQTPAVLNRGRERNLNRYFFKKLLHIDATDEGNQNLVGWINDTKYTIGTLKEKLREQYDQNITLEQLKEFFLEETSAVDLKFLKYMDGYSYDGISKIDLGKGRKRKLLNYQEASSSGSEDAHISKKRKISKKGNTAPALSITAVTAPTIATTTTTSHETSYLPGLDQSKPMAITSTTTAEEKEKSRSRSRSRERQGNEGKERRSASPYSREEGRGRSRSPSVRTRRRRSRDKDEDRERRNIPNFPDLADVQAMNIDSMLATLAAGQITDLNLTSKEWNF